MCAAFPKEILGAVSLAFGISSVRSIDLSLFLPVHIKRHMRRNDQNVLVPARLAIFNLCPGMIGSSKAELKIDQWQSHSGVMFKGPDEGQRVLGSKLPPCSQPIHLMTFGLTYEVKIRGRQEEPSLLP